MAPNNPPDRPVAPAFFDNGHEGTWLEAMTFARFPISDFEPRDDAGCRQPDADGFCAPFGSLHANPDSPEAQR